MDFHYLKLRQSREIWSYGLLNSVSLCRPDRHPLVNKHFQQNGWAPPNPGSHLFPQNSQRQILEMKAGSPRWWLLVLGRHWEEKMAERQGSGF